MAREVQFHVLLCMQQINIDLNMITDYKAYCKTLKAEVKVLSIWIFLGVNDVTIVALKLYVNFMHNVRVKEFDLIT